MALLYVLVELTGLSQCGPYSNDRSLAPLIVGSHQVENVEEFVELAHAYWCDDGGWLNS